MDLRLPVPERSYLHEALLLLGFVLLLAAAVVTVVIPELAKEPEEPPRPVDPLATETAPTTNE